MDLKLLEERKSTLEKELKSGEKFAMEFVKMVCELDRINNTIEIIKFRDELKESKKHLIRAYNVCPSTIYKSELQTILNRINTILDIFKPSEWFGR